MQIVINDYVFWSSKHTDMFWHMHHSLNAIFKSLESTAETKEVQTRCEDNATRPEHGYRVREKRYMNESRSRPRMEQLNPNAPHCSINAL